MDGLLEGRRITLYVGWTGMVVNGLLEGNRFTHSGWIIKGLAKFPLYTVCAGMFLEGIFLGHKDTLYARNGTGKYY